MDQKKTKEEVVAQEIVRYDLDISNILVLMSNYQIKSGIKKSRKTNAKNMETWIPLYSWSAIYMQKMGINKQEFCKRIGVEFYHYYFHITNAPSTKAGTVGIRVRAGIERLKNETNEKE